MARDLEDGVGDADKRFGVGDTRFVGVKGFVVVFPGLNWADQLDFVCRYGWRVERSSLGAFFAGLADEVSADLSVYAEAFNRRMLELVKEESSNSEQ